MGFGDCFGLCTPQGPDDPFGSPVLVVWDSLRVACLLVVAAGLAIAPWQMRRSRDPYQRSRFLGSALWAVGVAITEIQHVGDYASWRLMLNLAGAVLVVYGSWGFWRQHTERGP